ncbi:dihydrofolate reductase [Candidatus Woesebacteria bacterium]|nr:dihydrofolate reductase [Candidatus Woesebacteria bacterium]
MKVTLIASITADGFIAQNTQQSSLKWTSREDTRFFIDFTKKVGVLIMGSTTFATIGKPLPGRKIIVLTKSQKYDQFDSSQVVAESRSLKEIIKELSDSGQQEVAISGGSSVYTQFMKEGLVDELYLTVEPIVFGEGIKLFQTPINQNLNLIEIIDLSEQTKVMHYKVVR